VRNVRKAKAAVCLNLVHMLSPRIDRDSIGDNNLDAAAAAAATAAADKTVQCAITETLAGSR
jgi:hypothetical protein